MSEDRIGGALRKGAGQVQDALGGLTGDVGTQARGKLNQVAGSAQNAYDKTVDQAGDVYETARQKVQTVFGDVEEFIKAQPLAAVGVALAAGVAVGLVLHGARKATEAR